MDVIRSEPGTTALLMGNEAIARGVLEAGATLCAAYPGNPSSDILEALSKVAEQIGIHVEWSVNEKVALEVATSASFAGLRGFCAMKQNGLNVASDFLLNLNLSGVRGGLVAVVCDDPGGISSTNEQDSRLYAKMGELPLLEPSDFQEAKDMVVWAFDLSEELGLPCLVHSVTRLSHARGNVTLGPLRKQNVKPYFDRSRPFLNVPFPARAHLALRRKNDRCRQVFEKSSFNYYRGPERPDILLITTGAGLFYSREAVYTLGVAERVGILKIGTTWPMPEKFILKYLDMADQVAFVEEGGPFLEENVKELCADRPQLAGRRFMGKTTGEIPAVDELTPETVIDLLSRVLDVPYCPRTAEYADKVSNALEGRTPERSVSLCAGCPHRATYWAVKKALALDGRNAFILGDIGCYGMGTSSAGYHQVSSMHAMGSGIGLASGMGLLHDFGLDQPVVAVCGDGTFFHAGIQALINMRQNRANLLLLILDNGATAMTGFQPHAGLGRTATGGPAPTIEIGEICRAIGVEAEVQDPYDMERTTSTILRLLQQKKGARVLILKRECALVRAKRGGHDFRMSIDPGRCLGDTCGCNRFCTRVFRCPGLAWDEAQGKAKIDQAICSGCGVCSRICPANAIISEDA